MALHDKQLMAIDLILKGTMKKGDMAKELGVSPQALCQWQNIPEFRHRLNQLSLEKDEELRTGRFRYYKRLAEQGLSELSRRLDPRFVKGEKTKDLLDIVTKLMTLMGDEQNDHAKKIIIEDGTDKEKASLDDTDFRSGLRELLTVHGGGKK